MNIYNKINNDCVYYKDVAMARFEFIGNLCDKLLKCFDYSPKELKKVNSEIYKLILYSPNKWHRGDRRNIHKLHITVSLKMMESDKLYKLVN
jgi:hypothetical protein